MESTTSVDAIEVWDRPTDDRVLLIASIDRQGREMYVGNDGSIVGTHRQPDPTLSQELVVLTRESASQPWRISGSSHLLTRDEANGDLEDGNFVGLAIDDEVSHVGPIHIIDRADVGATGTYSNDGRNGCFFYELELLGRYPICLFADEVHVPSNTFGAVFVPVAGSDVVLAFGWAGRSPRWRYWTMEGDVHELFFNVRASAGRAFIFGAFTGQPRSFRVSGVEVPVSREWPEGSLLFERLRPPIDATADHERGASAWLWRESGNVSCLQGAYLDRSSRRACTGELLDGAASPTVGYAIVGNHSGPVAGPSALALSVPNDVVAVEVELAATEHPLVLEPAVGDEIRWVATAILRSGSDIESMTAVDSEGRRRTLDLPCGAHYEGAGLAYLPR